MSYTVPAEHQGPRRHAAVQIIVNGLAGKGGEDVTSKLHPYLISVQVIDSLEGDNDQCNIELDDRNAELQLPPDHVTLQVAMGWSGSGPKVPNRGRTSAPFANETTGGSVFSAMTEEYVRQFVKGEMPWGGPGMSVVFSGNVSSVESGFGRRGGGRRVWIEGTSSNVLSKAKEVQHVNTGEGVPDDSAAGGAAGGAAGAEIPLLQHMQSLFKESGLSVKLSPEMMKLKRPAWAAHQSPLDWAKQFAKDNGAYFKVANGVATMIKKGEAVNADGDPVPTIMAIWGINLIGWRIKPYTGRPQWGGGQARFFDIDSAEWQKAVIEIGGKTPFGGADAILRQAASVAGKREADQSNEGGSRDSTGRRGTGWVLVNGEPEVKAGFYVYIDKARPGVDGRYLITEVEHNYTRGVGYTTRMNVQYPEAKASDWGWKNDPGKFIPGITDAPKAEFPKVELPSGIDDPYYDPGEGVVEESIFQPGRSPISNFMRLFGRKEELSAEDKKRAAQWYANRNLPIPPEYQ